MNMLDNIKSIKIPKIGMRSIKTVMATFLAIMVSNVMGFESPFYATWTAFLCIQASIIESSQMAIKRTAGTVIGGMFALVYLVFVPDNMYVIPLGLLAIIYLCNLLGKSHLIAISCVVFLIISFRVNSIQDFDSVTYVINRVFETFVGIAIAILVNYYIKRPNPFIELESLNDELINFVKSNVKTEEQFKKVKNLEDYELQIDEYRDLIQFYHKEVNSKKHDLDIKYYMKNLTLFRRAYSHLLILNSILGEKNEEIKQYHIENLVSIKEELL